MSRARITRGELSGNEYDIVRFTEDTEWVLRDDAGDIITFEEGFGPGWLVLENEGHDPAAFVEVRCDFCGRWSEDVAPMTPESWESWMCFGGMGACPD